MLDLHMPNMFFLGIQDVEYSDCPEDNNLLKASPSQYDTYQGGYLSLQNWQC